MWMKLGLDPINERVFMMGYNLDRETALKEAEELVRTDEKNKDVCYIEAFNLADVQMPANIFRWLTSHGLPRVEAAMILKGIADELRTIINENQELADDTA